MGTLHVKDVIKGDNFATYVQVVATWLGASTHGDAIVLIVAIAIAINIGDDGNEARNYY